MRRAKKASSSALTLAILHPAPTTVPTCVRLFMSYFPFSSNRYSDVEVNNLTSSWEDGRAFLALLNDANPSEAPYRPVSDAILNRKKAYRLGEELFGVPQLLDYQDARVFHYEQVIWIDVCSCRLPLDFSLIRGCVKGE